MFRVIVPDRELGATLHRYNGTGSNYKISQLPISVTRSIEKPSPVKSDGPNPMLGNNFVYQSCPFHLRGETVGNRVLNVEAFVAGMYLGKFWMYLQHKSKFRIELDLFSGKGSLEFDFRGVEGSDDYGFWIKWSIEVWRQLFAKKLYCCHLEGSEGCFTLPLAFDRLQSLWAGCTYLLRSLGMR